MEPWPCLDLPFPGCRGWSSYVLVLGPMWSRNVPGAPTLKRKPQQPPMGHPCPQHQPVMCATAALPTPDQASLGDGCCPSWRQCKTGVKREDAGTGGPWTPCGQETSPATLHPPPPYGKPQQQVNCAVWDTQEGSTQRKNSTQGLDAWSIGSERCLKPDSNWKPAVPPTFLKRKILLGGRRGSWNSLELSYQRVAG